MAKPALCNFDPLIDAAFSRYPITQPVLVTDPASPPAGQVAAKRFGLANAGKRIASDIGD
jgi:hypothetical protein